MCQTFPLLYRQSPFVSDFLFEKRDSFYQLPLVLDCTPPQDRASLSPRVFSLDDRETLFLFVVARAPPGHSYPLLVLLTLPRLNSALSGEICPFLLPPTPQSLYSKPANYPHFFPASEVERSNPPRLRNISPAPCPSPSVGLRARHRHPFSLPLLLSEKNVAGVLSAFLLLGPLFVFVLPFLKVCASV